MKKKGRYQVWLIFGIFCAFVILPCGGYGADLSIGNTVSTTGNWTVTGTIGATSFSGDGSGLTSVNAEMLGGKTLSDLDGRYGQSSPTQFPRSNTISTIEPYIANGDISIAIGMDGLPVISFQNDQFKQLRVVHCGNAACSSGNSVHTIDPGYGADVGQHNSIAIGPDGLPIVFYLDATNNDLKVSRCANVSCSTGALFYTIDSVGNVGGNPATAIGRDGLAVVSYSGNGLRVAKCPMSDCHVADIVTVEPGGVYSSIAIGMDGLPVISHMMYYGPYSELRVVKCGDNGCSSGNTVTAVDSGIFLGLHTSITIGADGLPVISYQDYANKLLKVAKCGNEACSSGNVITTIDSGYGATSITIGMDGLPVVSYVGTSLFELKVAKCGDNACSSRKIITTVGPAGTGSTSITIGTDGLPIISYIAQNGPPMVIKCANQYCLNNLWRR